MGIDPHQTIPTRMRDINIHNMARNTPEGHMTRKKSKKMKGNPQTQIPEP
jgi:hypothetical protein